MKRFVAGTLVLVLMLAFSKQVKLSPKQLKTDFDVFKKALEQIHPGLYRYDDKTQVDKWFTDLEASLSSSKTDAEFSVLLEEMLAKIRCVHTRIDDPPPSLEELQVLPFDFMVRDGKMWVTKSLLKK